MLNEIPPESEKAASEAHADVMKPQIWDWKQVSVVSGFVLEVHL